MPTYMYKCTDCGHRFEEVQGFHDDPVDTCPECAGRAQRVIGNVGVTFKGSGFYRTDSRKASEPKKAKSESTSKSGDSASKSKDTGKSSSSGKTGGSSGTSSTKT